MKRGKKIEPFEAKWVTKAGKARDMVKTVKTRTQRNVAYLIKITCILIIFITITQNKYIKFYGKNMIGSIKYTAIQMAVSILTIAYIIFGTIATYKIHQTTKEMEREEEEKYQRREKKKKMTKAQYLTKKLEALTFGQNTNNKQKEKSTPNEKQLKLLGITKETYELYENAQERHEYHESKRRAAARDRQQQKVFKEETKQLLKTPIQNIQQPIQQGTQPIQQEQLKTKRLTEATQHFTNITTTEQLKRYMDSAKKYLEQPVKTNNTILKAAGPHRFTIGTTTTTTKTEQKDGFFKEVDPVYKKYIQATLGDMNAEMASYASTMISSEDMPKGMIDDFLIQQAQQAQIEEEAAAAAQNRKYDYNARFSGVQQTQPIQKQTKLDIQQQYAITLKTLNITTFQMSMWADRLKRWMVNHCLKPILKQIVEINNEMAKRSITPFDCTVPLDAPAPKQLPIPQQLLYQSRRRTITLRAILETFPKDPLISDRFAIENYLNMPLVSRSYLLKRLNTLASGSSISTFKYNSGGDHHGIKWEDYNEKHYLKLPTDAQIIMHLFCAYMNMVLKRDDDTIQTNFTDVHFSNVSTPRERYMNSMKQKPTTMAIVCEHIQPPYYTLKTQKQHFKIEPGRSNVFKTIVLFIFLVRNTCESYLQHVWLGNPQSPTSALLAVVDAQHS